MKAFIFAALLGMAAPALAHVDVQDPVAVEALAVETGELESVVKKKKVSFTLRNKSLRKIPLIIPGVMKPNLSPVSNSGVILKEGQKIIYKLDGKRVVLLVVDPSLEGQTVDVAKLIRRKKRALREESASRD